MKRVYRQKGAQGWGAWRWLCQESGALSLAATAGLAGVLSLALVLHQVVGVLSYRGEFEQAMSQQLAVSLARYDRSLQRRYGLWGLTEDQLKSDVFDRLMQQAGQQPLALSHAAHLDQTASNPLSEGAEAKRQMATFMRLRAPVNWAQEIQQRMQSVRKTLQDQVSTHQGGTREAIEAWLKRDRWLKHLEDAEADESHREAIEETLSQMTVETDLQAMGWMDHLYEGVGQAENWLQGQAIPIVDDLFVHEYLLEFFSYATASYGGSEAIGQTWRGQRRADLKTSSPYEVEQILTGMNSPEWAYRTVQLGIFGLRLIQHTGYLLTHPSQTSGLKALSYVISVLVAALSLGTVLVPPKLIHLALILIKAAHRAYRDVKTLTGGNSVALQPGFKHSFELYYKDFLRLFFWVVPTETLAHRGVLRIEENLQAVFYTGVQAQAQGQFGPWQRTAQRQTQYSIGPLRTGGSS